MVDDVLLFARGVVWSDFCVVHYLFNVFAQKNYEYLYDFVFPFRMRLFLLCLFWAPSFAKFWIEPLVFDKSRIFLLHEFMNKTECKHLINIAKDNLKRSTVVDGKGGGVVNSIRTSSGTFIRRRHDAIVEGIEERLSMLTLTPISHQEDIQILRYEPG